MIWNFAWLMGLAHAVDLDGDGWDHTVDCDDTDPAVSPGAREQCNGIDDDCDALVDEGCGLGPDDDGDGFDLDDCDDDDASVHPGADEVCNDIDDDGDGEVDNDAIDAVQYWFDNDGDGYGNAADGWYCPGDAPPGYLLNGEDCDDNRAYVHPGAREVCDGLDNDCDGQADEDTECSDDDGDGYTELAGDCDDGDPSIDPAEQDICDGVDNDCDGQVDEDCPQDTDTGSVGTELRETDPGPEADGAGCSGSALVLLPIGLLGLGRRRS